MPFVSYSLLSIVSLHKLKRAVLVGGVAFILVLIIWCAAWYRRRGTGKKVAASQNKKRCVTNDVPWPDKTDLVTSHIRRVTSTYILLYRACACVLSVAVLVSLAQSDPELLVITFTRWNWLLLTSFFCVATFISVRHACHTQATPELGADEAGSKQVTDEARNGLSFLERVYMVLLIVELPSTFFVALVTWTVLLPLALGTGREEEVLNVPSYFTHAGNIVLMLGEFLLTRVYIRAADLVFFVAWGVFYVFFHIMLMLSQDLSNSPHCAVYPFLDMSNPFFLALVGGLILFMLLFYGFVLKLSQLKRRFLVGRVDSQSPSSISGWKAIKFPQKISSGRA